MQKSCASHRKDIKKFPWIFTGKRRGKKDSLQSFKFCPFFSSSHIEESNPMQCQGQSVNERRCGGQEKKRETEFFFFFFPRSSRVFRENIFQGHLPPFGGVIFFPPFRLPIFPCRLWQRRRRCAIRACAAAMSLLKSIYYGSFSDGASWASTFVGDIREPPPSPPSVCFSNVSRPLLRVIQ